MNEYKYDLAFSFLAEDEPLAAQLNDLLQSRISTFLYSKRQEEVAGTDGELTFNDVFQSDARIVAILYRSRWGETPWTRMEQTAIRNRAYESGYDFAVFIPVEENCQLPPWVPKTQLWVGLERWGLEGAASVLEARVQQAGGQPRVESAIEKADRVRRQRESEEQRRCFLSSDAGVKAADSELAALFDELQRLTNEIDAFKMRTERDVSQFVVYSSGHSITFAWQLQWANSLDQSALWIMLWKGPVSLRGYAGRQEKLHEWEYDFDQLPTGQLGWRRSESKGEFFSSRQLADYCISRLLDELAG